MHRYIFSPLSASPKWEVLSRKRGGVKKRKKSRDLRRALYFFLLVVKIKKARAPCSAYGPSHLYIRLPPLREAGAHVSYMDVMQGTKREKQEKDTSQSDPPTDPYRLAKLMSNTENALIAGYVQHQENWMNTRPLVPSLFFLFYSQQQPGQQGTCGV